jgi:hypothetical protein
MTVGINKSCVMTVRFKMSLVYKSNGFLSRALYRYTSSRGLWVEAVETNLTRTFEALESMNTASK